MHPGMKRPSGRQRQQHLEGQAVDMLMRHGRQSRPRAQSVAPQPIEDQQFRFEQAQGLGDPLGRTGRPRREDVEDAFVGVQGMQRRHRPGRDDVVSVDPVVAVGNRSQGAGLPVGRQDDPGAGMERSHEADGEGVAVLAGEGNAAASAQLPGRGGHVRPEGGEGLDLPVSPGNRVAVRPARAQQVGKPEVAHAPRLRASWRYMNSPANSPPIST